jgi:SAM-dependent methyltransferase
MRVEARVIITTGRAGGNGREFYNVLMLETVPCNLCGAEGGETVYPAKYDPEQPRDLARVFRASADELLIDRLERCRECGLQFVNPRPPAAAIVEAYSDGDDPAYVSQIDARERTFDQALVRIERLNGGTGRILDIGTAAGAFLAAARKRGWDVEGCEPNRWMAEWSSKRYGLNVRPGEIFSQTYAPRSFDVVTLWDVIEHTPDPARVIDKCAELLKPDGLLVVNYPDIGSVIARAMGRRWPFLSSVHLYYFTRRTMRAFLERHGFRIVDMRPHVQRLELDYLLARSHVLSVALSQWSRRVARAAGLSRRQAPYWIGQTFVAARAPR